MKKIVSVDFEFVPRESEVSSKKLRDQIFSDWGYFPPRNTCEVIGVSIRERDGSYKTFVHDCRGLEDEKIKSIINDLANLILSPDVERWVCYSAFAELGVFGLYVDKLTLEKLANKLFDPMVIVHVTNSEKFKAMKWTCQELGLPSKLGDWKAERLRVPSPKERFIEVTPPSELIQGKEVSYFLEIGNSFLRYCAMDSILVLKIYEKIEPKIPKFGAWLKSALDLEMNLFRVISRIHVTGITIDRVLFPELQERLIESHKRSADKLSEIVGLPLFLKENAKDKKPAGYFLPSSNNDMNHVLYERMGFPKVILTEKGNGSVGSEALDYLSSLDNLNEKQVQFLEIFSNFKKVSKRLSSSVSDKFLSMIDSDGRVKTIFDPYKTTNRLSSRSPNLQQIPSSGEGLELRKLFIAGKGKKLLIFDYSQLEYRVLAEMSGQPELVKAYQEGEVDAHEATAKLLSTDKHQLSRSEGKSLNFAIVYGGGAGLVSSMVGCSIEQAKKFIEAYWQKLGHVKRLKQRLLDYWKKGGVHPCRKEWKSERGFVQNWMGMKRGLWKYDEGKVSVFILNSFIQGTSAEYVKWVMIKLHDLFRSDPYMDQFEILLQIHDELIIEVPEDIGNSEIGKKAIEKIRKVAEGSATLPPFQWKVPMKIDLKICDSWYQAKG